MSVLHNYFDQQNYYSDLYPAKILNFPQQNRSFHVILPNLFFSLCILINREN